MTRRRRSDWSTALVVLVSGTGAAMLALGLTDFAIWGAVLAGLLAPIVGVVAGVAFTWDDE